MMEIDEAIGRVEALFRTVTGRDAPEAKNPYAPIPAERDPMQHVQEQMDRLSQLLAGPAAPAAMARWIPAMGMWESEEEFLVCLDIPGVGRQGLEVTVQENMILVAGQRLPRPINGHRPRHMEHVAGFFRRTIQLPPNVKAEAMTASLKDGVLEIRIPREMKISGTPRTITVV